MMNIGYLIASTSRSAGGLFWAVKSLAGGICRAGVSLRVFAGEDAYSEHDIPEWGETPVNAFPINGPAAFGYQVGLRSTLASCQLDIAHVHGLWMYPSVAAQGLRKRGVPYMISPHGMLDPWALDNSGWKKRLAALLYENRHLRDAACIHALCEEEYASIRAYGLSNPVAIVPNGVDLPDSRDVLPTPQWADSLPAGSKVLFFLSRIHPKKGLVNLLQAWAMVQSAMKDAYPHWFLVIAGWEQGGHLVELKRLVAELRIEATVRFVGPQFGQDKAASFQRADAFILPSFSEGLPMAVLEAWSYGLPVLMTPQCNIPEGFTYQAALHIEPTVAGVAAGGQRLLDLDDRQLAQMGDNGLALVKEKFTWDMVADSMLAVYRWVLGQGEMPSCVRCD